MNRFAFIIIVLLGCIVVGCEKDDIAKESSLKPLTVESSQVSLHAVKKNKLYLTGTVDSDATEIYLVPEFENDLRNSTQPIYIQAWDVQNDYNLNPADDVYYVQWSIDREDFIGDAIYQHVLPRTPIHEYLDSWSIGFGLGYINNSENFWTDDTNSSNFNPQTDNKPLKWSWGNMIMKDVNSKPTLIVDMDKNNSGKAREILVRITASAYEFVFITIVQNN